MFHGSKIRIKFTGREKNRFDRVCFVVLPVGAGWTLISIATSAMEETHDD